MTRQQVASGIRRGVDTSNSRRHRNRDIRRQPGIEQRADDDVVSSKSLPRLTPPRILPKNAYWLRCFGDFPCCHSPSYSRRDISSPTQIPPCSRIIRVRIHPLPHQTHSLPVIGEAGTAWERTRLLTAVSDVLLLLLRGHIFIRQYSVFFCERPQPL